MEVILTGIFVPGDLELEVAGVGLFVFGLGLVWIVDLEFHELDLKSLGGVGRLVDTLKDAVGVVPDGEDLVCLVCEMSFDRRGVEVFHDIENTFVERVEDLVGDSLELDIGVEEEADMETFEGVVENLFEDWVGVAEFGELVPVLEILVDF